MTQKQALTILKTGANVFLTGEPGSGKTFLINKYVSYLFDHGINPAITASTGIAATHIGGMTIHSWSGIGIATEVNESDLKRLMKNEKLVGRIQKTKVLIIDEISMLSAETLSLAEKVIRRIKGVDLPFGGIQVVLVGDFFQLPPVSHDGKPHFCFESEVWEKLDLTVCYLTEQHRQEDSNFLSLLSAIRKNCLEESHFVHLDSRIQPFIENTDPITKLYSHNANVDFINNQKLESLSGETHIYHMESYGRQKYIPALIKGCLSPEELFLKLGAVVMFTKNNPREGYVNGTIGTVTGFDVEKDYPIVETKSGVTILVGPASWAVEENGIDVATITQIPLRLAWAITIHKSQGMSLDTAVVDLRQVFEFGQGYVALSRVRELSGLYLLGYNEHSLMVHPDILSKDHEFRISSGKAYLLLTEISDVTLQEIYTDFIQKCGGTIEKVPAKEKRIKINTFEQTLKLIEDGKSLAQIAKERDLATTTVIGHLERLFEKDKISQKEIEKLISKKVLKALPTIKLAFKKQDTDKLTPVFKALNEKYSFNELRLARLAIKDIKEMTRI